MIELSMIRDIVAIFGVIAGFSYYVLTVRNANKARKTQLFTQIYQARYNPENIQRWWEIMSWEWEDFDDYYGKYGGFGVDPKLAAVSTAQFSYYDGIGLLVKNKMVDVNTVFHLMSAPIVSLWFKVETVIKAMREMEHGPGKNYMESFEYLANEMIKMRKQNGIGLPILSLHATSTLQELYP
jgi:hypothetical protein